MIKLPEDLNKFGLDRPAALSGELRTGWKRRNDRRVTKEEAIYLGNSFATSHQHATYESLLPAFANMTLMKNG